MSPTKKQPLRKCLGCGEMKEKKELVRIVRSAEGEISLDPTGRKNGRGAYVCHNSECLKAAQKARRLEKAFRCKIDDELFEQLYSQLEQQ